MKKYYVIAISVCTIMFLAPLSTLAQQQELFIEYLDKLKKQYPNPANMIKEMSVSNQFSMNVWADMKKANNEGKYFIWQNSILKIYGYTTSYDTLKNYDNQRNNVPEDEFKNALYALLTHVIENGWSTMDKLKGAMEHLTFNQLKNLGLASFSFRSNKNVNKYITAGIVFDIDGGRAHYLLLEYNYSESDLLSTYALMNLKSCKNLVE